MCVSLLSRQLLSLSVELLVHCISSVVERVRFGSATAKTDVVLRVHASMLRVCASTYSWMWGGHASDTKCHGRRRVFLGVPCDCPASSLGMKFAGKILAEKWRQRWQRSAKFVRLGRDRGTGVQGVVRVRFWRDFGLRILSLTDNLAHEQSQVGSLGQHSSSQLTKKKEDC